MSTPTLLVYAAICAGCLVLNSWTYTIHGGVLSVIVSSVFAILGLAFSIFAIAINEDWL